MNLGVAQICPEIFCGAAAGRGAEGGRVNLNLDPPRKAAAGAYAENKLIEPPSEPPTAGSSGVQVQDQSRSKNQITLDRNHEI